ncbi:hypothetical protein CDD83_10544 [Cordyceps sp. RAO-2017]|nr:hypothetical protein CDD83_10544 [Cordyceps sp. RAO-2017]
MPSVSCLLQIGLFANALAASRQPSDAIHSLNTTLGGRVRPIEPFSLPCYSKFNGRAVKRNEALCAERQAHYTDPAYRREMPGAYMSDTSSIDASDAASTDQCLLDPHDPTNPDAWEGRDCRLGNLPSYYIQVESAADALEAFRHARMYGVRLSIKTSGHSYVGDAGMKDSVLLWTRKLQHMKRHRRFVPSACPDTETFDAITTGAGVSCGEAYRYADEENVTIICGYSPTVGISGGWTQGGGHSVLSNVYGLGADRVVQFTVVTPDGRVRVANKCQNSDLFWALRGGGGGTYGLVMDSTHIVEPSIRLSVASISVPGRQDVVGAFLDLMVDTAIELARDGWGGHIYGNKIVYVNPLITTLDSAKKSMGRVTELANAYGGSSDISISPNWYHFFEAHVLSSSYPVGNLNLVGCQLVPASLFENRGDRQKVKSHLRRMLAEGRMGYIPADSPYLAGQSVEANETSVHPAWYSSLWQLCVAGRWEWNSTLDERVDVAQKLQRDSMRLRRLTGSGAAYKNEANPFTVDWKTAWYGGKYEALLIAKKKYDPQRLLRCWGCVGWQEQDAEESTYTAFNQIY